MPSDEESRFFEIYKLHTELAERVARLREDLNKLYASVITSIVAASVIAHRISPELRALWVLPALGMLLSVVWVFSLTSVTGRLASKHDVLVDMEADLPFAFLKNENSNFEKRDAPRRKLTAKLLPWTFFAVCAVWLVVLGVGSMCGKR